MVCPGDFTIGWLSALNVELVAALEHLDEEFSDLDGIPNADDNAYTLGRIGKHHVVLIVLPMGGTGKASTATAVRDMVRSFPNIRIALLVGIGGGAPTTLNDIRLGDVVVSTPAHGIGGVLPYDVGKSIQGQEFRTTGIQNQPPRAILTAVQALSARHIRYGHQISQSICKILEAQERLRGTYARPAEDTDTLFRSDVTHEVSCLSGCTKDESHIIARQSRQHRQNDPEIHYGVIASADRVLCDAVLRDKLATSYGVLCFEMEAAGLMNHLDCLVIWGISDYSDTHKNKAWQGYASMTASAYTKELLLYLTSAGVRAEAKLHDKMTQVHEEVLSISTVLLHKEQEAFIKDLRVFDYAQKYASVREAVVEGSGLWFIHSHQFQGWLHGGNRLLWCSGGPGAGKTVMTSIVINHLQKRLSEVNHGVLAYIYFDYGYKDQAQTPELLLSIWAQLVTQRTLSHAELRSYKDVLKNEKHRPPLQKITSMLTMELALRKPPFMVVVDALDECPHGVAVDFISQLLKLDTKLKLLITSRNSSPLVDCFVRYLPIEAHRLDIQLYVDDRIQFDQGLSSCVERDPELHSSIIQAISESSAGLFLLANLNLNFLSEADESPRSLREALMKIPTGPNRMAETYANAVARIKQQNGNARRIGMRAIEWVALAHGSMTAEDLIVGLSIRLGDKDVDKCGFVSRRNLLSYCGGLLDIASDSNLVRFIHKTTKEYFDTLRDKEEFADARFDLALSCATYLNFETPRSFCVETSTELLQVMRDFPFFIYATWNAGNHFHEAKSLMLSRQIPDLESLSGLFQRLFVDEEKVKRASIAIVFQWLTYAGISLATPRGHLKRRLKDFHASPTAVDGVSAEKLAAFYNLLADDRGRSVLGPAFELPKSSSQNRSLSLGTSLHWACLGSAFESCQILLSRKDRDSVIELRNKWGKTPASLAAFYGSERILGLLLASGQTHYPPAASNAVILRIFQNRLDSSKTALENYSASRLIDTTNVYDPTF